MCNNCSTRRLFDKYFALVSKAKWFIIAFWVIVLALGAAFGPLFLSAVSIQVDPPKGTRGYDAKRVFTDLFNDKASTQDYLFYLDCGACETSVNSLTYYRAYRLIAAAESWKGGFVKGHQTWWTYPNTTAYAGVKERYVSPSKPSAMIALITTEAEHDTTELKEFVRHVRDAISGLGVGGGDYVGFLGSNTILVDSVEESSTTVTEIDAIVLPLALMVLVYVVQSWRMIIIPIINVFTCLLSSFAMMYGLTKFTVKAPSFVPSVMEAMVIALSIDYSLFILTRYRFEIMENGRRGEEAVREAAFHAGEVVFMSGLTLVSCFLGMTGFPTETVYMVGVGCAICLTMALVINLTMTPAILLAFPRTFSTFQVLPFCTRKEGPGAEEAAAEAAANAVQQDEYQLAPDDDDSLNPDNSANSLAGGGKREVMMGLGEEEEEAEELKSHRGFVDDDERNEKMVKSYWYRSTRLLIKWPYVFLTILIPLALITPAAVQLFKFKYSIDNDQIAPRNSLSLQCYKRVESTFPLGLTDPLYVIVDAASQGRGALQTERFFNASATLSQLIVDRTACGPAQVASIAYLNGIAISWAQSKKLREQPGFYGGFFNQSVDHDMNAALITMTTPFAPFGDQTKGFVNTIRDSFNDGRLPGEYKYYLAGAAIWVVDATDVTFELFPYIILATVLAIFTMISLLMMSAFIPLRYAFTLVFPLSFIFGLAVMVYQDNKLGGLGWAAISGDEGMYWLSPIITFPICTGLALDYDIFLMCRVAEYRMEGFTDRASILKAVHETGGIITAAGVIMAIAFGGLLFSQTDTLNQIGWILFSSVLFDTFVVRTILVPAVLIIAGRRNWWPRRIPTVGLKDEFGNLVPDEGNEHRLISVNTDLKMSDEGKGGYFSSPPNEDL